MSRKSRSRVRSATGTPPPLPVVARAGAAAQMTSEHGLTVTSSPVNTIELSVDDIIEHLPDAAREATENLDTDVRAVR